MAGTPTPTRIKEATAVLVAALNGDGDAVLSLLAVMPPRDRTRLYNAIDSLREISRRAENWSRRMTSHGG